MDVISKCAVAALIGAIVSLVIKKNSPDFSTVIGIAATVLVLTLSLSFVSSVRDIINCAVDMLGTSSALLRPLLKCMSISLITKFSADVCRDAAHSSAASALELSGTLCALAIAAPIVTSMLKMIGTMV